MSGAGRFISVEGGEGAGKSTNIRRLKQALEAAGITVVATREPGGSPGAEQIRKLLVEGVASRWDPICETLLHCAARRDHVERVVRPALERGEWVLSDRFADSTMAYQGYGHGVARELIEILHREAIGDLQPDLTLILDLPASTGLARAGMGVDFHRRLRDGFLDIARREPDRCAVIDAMQDIETVQTAIRETVAARLGVDLS